MSPHPHPSPTKQQILSQLHQTPCNIVRTLVRAGHEAYIVGGAIRDLLTGNPPKDYDICTSATPEQVRAVFGRRRCHVIGRRFRLAHVYSGGELYEVSTFRRLPSESERHGRKDDDGPLIWNDNCYGTLEEDAQRRDYTCNALYFDVTGSRGIIDFSGGIRDIREGIVRCIGDPDERLSEDPVRIVRALKLVGQFGFRLESNLERAIREKAEMIHLSSSSRLFEELLKILNHPDAGETLAVMHNIGFLKEFWPTVDDAWDDQEGEMLRNLLKLRGDALRRGRYSSSRGLALTTVSMPYLMSAMNPENPLGFWDKSLIGNELAHRALKLIFEGFLLPRIFEDRILIIAGLVPKLRTPPVPPRILNNAEYRYARAMVALLAQLFGWDQSFLKQLPEFSPRYDLGELVSDETSAADGGEDAGEDGNETAEAEEKPAKRPRRPRRRRGRKEAVAEAETTAAVPEAVQAETPNAEAQAPAPPPAKTAADIPYLTAAPKTDGETAAKPRKTAAPRKPRRPRTEKPAEAKATAIPTLPGRDRSGDGESITFG